MAVDNIDIIACACKLHFVSSSRVAIAIGVRNQHEKRSKRALPWLHATCKHARYVNQGSTTIKSFLKKRAEWAGKKRKKNQKVCRGRASSGNYYLQIISFNNKVRAGAAVGYGWAYGKGNAVSVFGNTLRRGTSCSMSNGAPSVLSCHLFYCEHAFII